MQVTQIDEMERLLAETSLFLSRFNIRMTG